jgi:hypothetical protein
MSKRGARFWFAPAILFAAFFTSAPANAIDIQRVISDGGIEAWLVEDHS